MNNKKGFGLPSVIIGSIIGVVLSAVAVSSMWGSVSKSKDAALLSVVKELQTMLAAQRYNGFSEIVEANRDEVFDSRTWDYLVEAQELGLIDTIDTDIFKDPDNLTFELRSVKIPNTNKLVFYVALSSTNSEDQEMIDRLVEKLGKPIEDIRI